MKRFAVIAVCLVLTGCRAEYDQRGGRTIAASIRTADPIVASSDYNPGDDIDSASIDVTVDRGVTKSEAAALMCDVIHPIIASGDPPESLGVTVWDAANVEVLATDVEECP